MDTLILRLASDPAAPLAWCRAEAPAAVDYGPLSAAAAAAAGRAVTVLVPGTAVTLATARIPTRQRQRLRQALPFALEEQLASDVETLHFAVAERSGADELYSAVIDRALLQGQLAQLAGAGIEAHALLPDLLALPRAPGDWSLLLESGGFLLRSGEWSGLAGDDDALLLLALRQEGSDRPARLRLYVEPSETARVPAIVALCAELGIELQQEAVAGGALPLLARTTLRGIPLNLLQGEFGRREQHSKRWRPWRTAAALAAAVLLLQGAMVGTRYVTLARQNAQLTAAIDALYRNTFPDAKRVVNARAQMEQKLRELRAGATGQEFHRLLSSSAGPLHSTGVELRSLQYTAGRLEVEVSTADLQGLDRLKQALNASPEIRAEITNADNSDGKVSGRLSIRGNGA